MQAGPQDVDRRLEQRRVNIDRSGQLGHRRVSRYEVPGTIEYDSGVGLVPGKDSIERLAHGRELSIRERALGKCRSVASGEQELILLAERDVKLLSNRQKHFA